MTNSKLTLRSLTATAVTLPMKRPLGTSAESIDNACLVLVDLLTQDGIEGRAYVTCRLLPVHLSGLSQIRDGMAVFRPAPAMACPGTTMSWQNIDWTRRW
jgi:mandelate racemase